MKRFLLTAACLMVLSGISIAQVSFGAGGHAGLSFSSFPKGVKDYYGTGFGGGVHGDLNVVKNFSARFSLDYLTFPSDKKKIAELVANQNGVSASDITFEGLNLSAISISLNALGKIPITKSSVTPYGVFNFGINFLSGSDGKVTYQGVAQPQADIKTESKTKFGLGFGAGTEFAVSPTIRLFLEFKYAMIFTDDENTNHLPLMVGATFGF